MAGTGARYTWSNPPKRLLAKIEYPTQQAASRAEWETKQMTVSEKRALVRQLRTRSARVKPTQGRAKKR